MLLPTAGMPIRVTLAFFACFITLIPNDFQSWDTRFRLQPLDPNFTPIQHVILTMRFAWEESLFIFISTALLSKMIPKISSWAKKMPDFAGHDHFFEDEVPRSEIVGARHAVPLQNYSHFFKSPLSRAARDCLLSFFFVFLNIFLCALCSFAVE
jgi:hypothetical protein